MLVPNHGVLQPLVILSILVAVIFSSESENKTEGPLSQNLKNETSEQDFEVRDNENNSVSDILKSHRRAPRFDKSASTSYVRVFNRPPGTKESFYNYETRGNNTSAHTSGEVWGSFFEEDHFGDDAGDIDRSDVKVKDILRVKPKTKDILKTDTLKSKTTSEAAPIPNQISTTTESPNRVVIHPASKLGNQKEDYIIWTSDDTRPKTELPFGAKTSSEDTKSPSQSEKIVLKDGSNWKVIGDGGEEGWQVVDDNGEVEWKIEYDDGEWRVISTGDFPSDAEWVDPEYVWRPPENAGNREPDYNSWQPEDYKSPPSWTNADVYYTGTANESWPLDDDKEQKKDDASTQIINSEWKPDSPPSASENTNEKVRFGVRKNIPTNIPDTSSVDEKIPEEDKNDIPEEGKPLSDEIIFVGKSWVPQAPVLKSDQKWVQGYGGKSWESDNTGWNSKSSGETWVSANKYYATDPWIPKIPNEKTVVSDDQQTTSSEENNSNMQDKSVRAWGTGYGTKTWKGNEWDSNVVWKTGISNLPWSDENNTWQFPETNKEKKKPEVWSQPIPSKVATSGTKNNLPPNKRLDGIRAKWPIRPVNKEKNILKSPPSRRTESESWSDDDSDGGVVWKPDESDDSTPTGPKLSFPRGNGWRTKGWKVASGENQQPTTAPWKNNPPPKSSNLVSVSWKAGETNPLDSAAAKWAKGQWPGANLEPTWLFQGCKMTLKCGTTDEITNDDYQSTLPDTSDDDTAVTTTTTAAPIVNVQKGWPPKQNFGKSWKPPSKTWKPPKWKKPTTAPTTPEPMTPTIPKSKINWKKPHPNTWKQPPTTMMWTETTPQPPEMTWKPPPAPMKWKKIPKPTKSWKPPPTKSWKPPPTKSWKPPKMPVKTWPSPIATPQPDNWPTTKPDCKDVTDTTEPSQQPTEDDDMMEPPQIIIITKLPKKFPIGLSDKKDKEGSKIKPSLGPWIFPQRKYKSSKNRKDKNIPIGTSKWQQNRPSRNSFKNTNMNKGWPKNIPPTKFTWPSNAMRRWTTKNPTSFPTKKLKYPKSRSWREIFKKLMNGL